MSSHDLSGIGMTSQRTRDRLVKRLAENGIDHDAVLSAVASVPRHIFIDEALAHRAYEDTALPIGHGQTISQPYIVALMTQSLLNRPRPRVLEIGTGSGYQCAVLASLAPLVQKIYTIERIDSLIERAQARLRVMKCHNVRFKHADGYQGWRKESPFDGILVTAAARYVPEALLDQLAVGGRMVLPIGDEGVQQLKVYDRTPDGFDVATVDYVRFVPLLKGVR